MIFFHKTNDKAVTVAKNFDSLPAGELKCVTIKTEEGFLEIHSNDYDMVKSSKIFGKVTNLTAAFFDRVYDYFIKQFEIHTHTLKKIQAQLTQMIEGVVPDVLLAHAETYRDQKNAVITKIHESPDEIADALIYLKKRIFELDAHMMSFEILHLGKNIHIDKKDHNVRKLIMSVWHGFEDQFNEREINLHFKFSNLEAESCKLNLDYKTINAALYNLFDNALKYTKPYSDIFLYLIRKDDQIILVITMMSFRIEKGEINKIFDLGYRGINIGRQEGSGVGMYIVRRALELNDLSIQLEPEYGKSEMYENKQFVLNKFIITRN